MAKLQFGCKTAWNRTIPVDGLRLHLLEWGTPGQPAICFLHGGSAHAHWFDLVVPAFAERFHIVALDQRGHGESDWPCPPAYGTEQFAADLEQVMDALHWREAIIVGHSMGGHNAMAFAAWQPARVRALVVADSRPSIPEDRLIHLRRRGHHALRLHPTLDAAVAAFRLLPRETFADPELLAHLARVGVVQRDGGWMYRFDPDSNRARQPVDTWTLLDRIAAPTLIVRAEFSPILPPELAERMRAAIAGARLVQVPRTYHHLVLDAPDAFARVLDAFLKSLPG